MQVLPCFTRRVNLPRHYGLLHGTICINMHFLYISQSMRTAHGNNKQAKATQFHSKFGSEKMKASKQHINHAALNHLFQVFLGQQGFPTSAATSLIIRLCHFPEELHPAVQKIVITQSYYQIFISLTCDSN